MKQAYQTNADLQDIRVVKRIHLIRSIKPTEAGVLKHSNTVGAEQRAKRERSVFPVPGKMKTSDDAFFCAIERVLALFNKHHRKNQKKVTSIVKSWFEQEALRVGWGEAIFLPDTQTGRSAGCMLRTPMKKGSSHVTNH
ncbi:hypothetical protein C7H85_11365 [Zobellella endophytica]|uniref:Uncharacterized protein n=1 Tax=Zobellella endophytica TaxID=2116700 RepID=A0A2P7R4V6_9GAMM|nr:hypothetical protein [Zobellella endophytica]PSJ45247.1 hypothetical protein C7H85_11365 [Zobellella endophytica]